MDTTSWHFRSEAYNMVLVIEEHGGQTLGIENVVFRPSRAIAGKLFFFCLNGRAQMSEDERYMLLKDANMALVVDLKTDEVYHLNRPEPNWLGRVNFEDGKLVGDSYSYNPNVSIDDPIEMIKQRSQTTPFKPVALEDLEKGFGAIDELGHFPSADRRFVHQYLSELAAQ